ncbi:hypothetical protein V8E52_004520 [Russula decolorans]
MTLSLSLRAYLSAHSVPINVLGGVEELAEVRYANEQCMVLPRLNRGLCNPCCSLSSRDEIIVGWTAFFDVGGANTAAQCPITQPPWRQCRSPPALVAEMWSGSDGAGPNILPAKPSGICWKCERVRGISGGGGSTCGKAIYEDQRRPSNGSYSNAWKMAHQVNLILIRKKPVAERLVTTVLRDATDGMEVWKTVSYMLLDCLVNLSRDDKHGNILLTLVRHGFLDVFVQDIKD